MNTYSEYPAVDLVALNEAAKGAYAEGITIERLQTQTGYLPTFYKKVTRIDHGLRTAHYQLKEILASLSTPLGLSLERFARSEASYNRAQTASKPAVIKRMVDEVLEILRLVDETREELRQKAPPLLETVELDATRRFLADLAVEAEQLLLDMEALTQRKETLEQEHRTLTDALSLIESKGFAQVGKDTILNAQQVSKLALATPELALLEQGIEFAQKVLDEAQGLVNYVSLTKARDVVRQRVSDLSTQVESKKGELDRVGMRQELITATHRFDGHQTTYITEFKKIKAALSAFLDTHTMADLQDETVRAGVINQTTTLITHLNTITHTR
jgi:hypothetical protein